MVLIFAIKGCDTLPLHSFSLSFSHSFFSLSITDFVIMVESLANMFEAQCFVVEVEFNMAHLSMQKVSGPVII